MKQIDYLFIGGKRVPASSSAQIEVISPHNEEICGVVPSASIADVNEAVRAAASSELLTMDADERIEGMVQFADVYERRLDDMADAMTLEMGCPATIVRLIHVEPALRALRYYIDVAREFPFEEYRQGARRTLVRRRPVGVAAAIIPWNGPAYLSMMKLAPALAAGCPTVLKPAPEAPLSSYVLAEIAEESGLAPGALNIIPGEREASEHLVGHPDVMRVSFTGSSEVGSRVAEVGGRMFKRVSLELGGKSAAIVLEDADPMAVAESLRLGSFANTGQVCTARTRILVPWSRYDEHVDALVAMANSVRVGDPFDPQTEMGPLVSARQRDRVLDYIRIGVEEGASVAAGGGAPAHLSKGYYVSPTVFVGVSNDMRIAQEEIFGPVVSVIGYSDDAEAVAITNDSPYGLSGSVFTDDIDRGVSIARRCQTGTFGINQFGNDITAPFGGVKASGLGREMGPEGLGEYLEFQSILVPAAP